MTIQNRLGIHPVTVIILFIFFLIFCSISLVNHYLFRTASMDLGVNIHALYSYANFQKHDYTLWLQYNTQPQYSYLGDHFSPIIFLYVPFYYLFGSYSLLIIQIISILIGGIGIYKLVSLKTENEILRNLIVLQFFGIWAIYSALSFDFHNNVVGSMFVPWLFYYFEKRNLKGILITAFSILITKENMALWLAFLFVGIYINDRFAYFKTKPVIFTLLPIITILYFFIIVSIVMPALNHLKDNFQLIRYEELGKSPLEIINFIINHPRRTFALLFETSKEGSIFHGVKSEFYFMLLFSGGFLLFRKPGYLLMLLPLIGQKMFSDNVILWGISCQYSIEFAPLISIALIDFITYYKSNKGQLVFILIILTSTWYFNYVSFTYRIAPFNDTIVTKFYSIDHYKSKWDIKKQYSILQTIPPDEIISVHSHLVPHLAARKKIYNYPIIGDANYLILLKETNKTFPLALEDYNNNITALENSIFFQKIRDDNNILIFKRKKIDEEEWLTTKKSQILQDSVWVNFLRQKALEKNVPFDTLLINDTKYLLYLEYKKVGLK